MASNGTDFLAVSGAIWWTSTDTAHRGGTVLVSTDAKTWGPRGTEPLDAVTWAGTQWLGVWFRDVIAEQTANRIRWPHRARAPSSNAYDATGSSGREAESDTTNSGSKPCPCRRIAAAFTELAHVI